MRGAWAAVAAGLLLAACSVEVEGARCERPFAADQCPSGQACGNDHRCSARAAACAAPCCPGGTEGCAESAAACGDAAILRCDGTDGICGAWAPLETCLPGLVCREGAGGEPACLCPVAAGTLHADAAAGSAASATPPPTGAGEPASCRFVALADALDAAAAQASGGAGATVEARGAFRTALEPRPLGLAAGVTLRAAVQGASVELDAAGDAGLRVGAGAAVEDVTVRSAGPDATGVGVEVTCDATTPVTLTRVAVEHAEGAGQLAAGVRVSAPCVVTAAELRVSGAAVGLMVTEQGTPPSQAIVDVTGSTLTSGGRGVELQAGRLTLTDAVVTDNAAEGILAAGDASREIAIADSLVARNSDGGLVLQGNQRIDLRNTKVCGNGAMTPRAVALTRLAGGLALLGNPPLSGSLVFRGNSVFSNAGDQVLVSAAFNPWKLDGAASAATCSTDANLIFAYPGDPAARGLFAASASVTATYNAWEGVSPTPPPSGRDYEATIGNTVDAGATGNRFCLLPSLRPTCD